jgi:hypothetical protein
MPAICQHTAKFCARAWPGPVFLRADNEYRCDLAARYRRDLAARYRRDLAARYRRDLAARYRRDLAARDRFDLGEWLIR